MPKLEISLVLDVSGSMRGTKIARLRDAAKQFVTTILETSEEGNAVISVIPFSWTVTPPQTVFDALSVDITHNYSTCLRFDGSDYQHSTLTAGGGAAAGTASANQMIYTSLYGGFRRSRSMVSHLLHRRLHAVPALLDERGRAPRQDRRAAIRWQYQRPRRHELGRGAARSELSDRLGATDRQWRDGRALAHVPADYDEPETLKVVVMMGDGANTTSYFFDAAPSAYRGPNSDLYRVEHQEQEFDYAFDIYNRSREWHEPWVEQYCHLDWLECVYEVDGPVISTYYLRDPSPERYFDLDEEEWLSPSEFDDLEDLDGFVQKERLSWEKAWGMMSPRFYGETTGSWGAWNDLVGSERMDGGAKDVRMRDVCGATKGRSVVVYSIGFQVSQGGRAERVLSDCASSSSHYYRANTTDISAVFSSIAANVQNLRLTQ